MFKVLCLLLALCGLTIGRPQFQAAPIGEIEFGVDANGCVVGPSGKVCPTGSVQFTSEAKGVFKATPPRANPPKHRFVHHHPGHPVHRQFTGLVGPSGVIGPSGLVGPSGPLAFGR